MLRAETAASNLRNKLEERRRGREGARSSSHSMKFLFSGGVLEILRVSRISAIIGIPGMIFRFLLCFLFIGARIKTGEDLWRQ